MGNWLSAPPPEEEKLIIKWARALNFYVEQMHTYESAFDVNDSFPLESVPGLLAQCKERLIDQTVFVGLGYGPFVDEKQTYFLFFTRTATSLDKAKELFRAKYKQCTLINIV